MTELTIFSTEGVDRFSTPINEGAKRVKTLMADDYVTLPFNTDYLIDFHLGDFVDVPNEGRFCITELPLPSVDDDNGGYNYELKLDAQYKKWGSKIYKYRPQTGSQECSWSLTASIDVHAEQLQIAINSLAQQDESYKYNGSQDWAVEIDGSVDVKVAKPITFDNINILDAISSIAESFECEWWVTDNIVWFGRCEFGDTEVELSRELNVTSITRSDTGEKTANRIYPYGSTENLPAKYNRELIFKTTNYYAATDSDFPDRIAITDKERPLSISWFDKSRWEIDNSCIKYYDVESSQGENVIEANTPNGENILLYEDSINIPLQLGKHKISLKNFTPKINTTFTPDGGGSWNGNRYYIQTILRYSLTLEDNEIVEVKETIANSNVILGSTANSLKFDSNDVELEIPAEYSNNGISKKVIGVTNCEMGIQFIAVSFLKGILKWEFKPVKNKITIENGDATYHVDDVELVFNNGNTYLATFAQSFADKGQALVLQEENSQEIEIGDTFTIRNIDEDLIPSSYYSYSNKTDEYQVVNAIADGRLKLPIDRGSYIDAYRYDESGNKVYVCKEGENGYDAYLNATEMPLDEAIEDVVIFEDVRPDYHFEVTEAWSTNEEVTDEDDTKRMVFKFFLYDNLFTADKPFKEKYQLEGTDLTIRFSSGKLNGMEFGLSAYNELNKPTRWEVTVDESTNLPNQFYAPEVGDTFTIGGLNVTIIGDRYLPEAEIELYDKAVEYVKQTNLDASAYDCIMKSEVMADGLHLGLGQRVLLKESIFFKNGRSSRVIGYEYPLDYPYDNPKYTIGEKPKYSRLGDIENKLESLEFSQAPNATNVVSGGVGGSSSSSSVHVIGTNDTTPASDKNVLSSLRSLAEFVSRKKNETINYLWRFAKGIEIGQYFNGVRGAKINEDGEAEVETLTSRSTIDGNIISASGYIQSPQVTTKDFAQGSLSGTGGGYYTLNGLTYAEFDYLTARKGATFAELIIQEYRSIAGSLVVSEANGEIEDIYKWSNGNGYDIYLKEWNTNNQFQVNDLVRCQYWDRTTYTLTSYWVRVTGVNANLKLINFQSVDFADGVEPKVGDKLVQMGNKSDTNRQGCILITTENGLPRIAMLDGIDEPKIYNTPEKTNYKGIYGSLEGFVDPYTGKTLSGYGMWGENVHLHGDLILSSTNKSVSDSLKDVGTGRNLLLATNQGIKNWSFSSSLDKGNYSMQEIDYNGAKGVQMKNLSDGSATYEIIYFSLRPQFIKKDKTYHLSFDLMQTANNNVEIDFSVSLSKSDSSNSLNNPIHVSSKDVGGIWRHYNVEFNAIADGEENGGQVVYFNIRPNAREWQDFAIANLKLEEGMKATDWSQAPEDVSTDLADFKTEVGKEFEVTNGKFESIQYKVEGSSSARNLLLKSNEGLQTKNYFMGSYYLGNSKPQKGDVVTLSFTANVFDDRITRFRVFNSGGTLLLQNNISIKEYRKDIKISSTFTWNINDDGNTHINIYQTNDDFERLDDLYGNTIIKNIKLEFGDVATEWSIAPEESNTYTESRIKQTADNIELKVKNGLAETGIDIENKKITVTADNFTIKNNNDKIVASADKFGNWSTNTLITLNDDGTKAITINEEGNRILTHYYPYTNQKQLEEGWNGTSLFRYFDENGVMLWQLGGAKGFMDADHVEWTAVGLYDTGFRFEVEYFESYKMRFTSVGDKELSAYYQHNVDNATPKMYETKSTNNPLNGWFTNQVSWQPFDSYPEGFVVRIWKRQFIHYTNGVEDWRHQLKWDMDTNEVTII